MYEESAATYTKVFDQLKERGLEKVWLVVSDAHKGLVKAAREAFLGCSWQRCKVHFMRNILAHADAATPEGFCGPGQTAWHRRRCV